MDVDTFSRIPKQLGAAIQRAQKTTGLEVPFSAAGVADAPYHLGAYPGLLIMGVTILDIPVVGRGFIPRRTPIGGR